MRRAVVGEPPAFTKHDGLYCYTPEQGTAFIQWRADADAACVEQVADRQEDADVAKVRQGSSSSGVSLEIFIGVLVAIGAAAFAGGTVLGAAVR